MESYFISDFITAANHHFTVDDLFVDFPTDDDVILNNSFEFNSENSELSGGEPQVSGNISSGVSKISGGELCVPCDELGELEWLSRFTEESFSGDDLNNLRLISAVNKVPVTSSQILTQQFEHNNKSSNDGNKNSTIFQNDVLVPAKTRSKRSRAPVEDWSSRLVHLKPKVNIEHNEVNERKTTSLDGSVRTCLHCGSEKTPQWRRGPMGPKTLCNACGVRFKSGRLVPEYRPAASPTFVPTKHSNSHRKVMELRRQMELRNSQMVHGSSYEGCNGSEEYLIHRQIGPNFMHMI